MAFRYIHKGWKLFWEVIFVILVVLLVLAGGAFIALQLDATEDIIAQKIENEFAQKYAGHLAIGDLDGMLPLNAVLKNVKLIADTDSTRPDTVIAVNRIEVDIDLWMLLQNKLLINRLALNKPTVRLLANNRGSYTLFDALQSNVSKDTSGRGGKGLGMQVVVPEISIMSGQIYIQEFYNHAKSINLPEPLTVHSLNTRIFVKLSEDRRFLDIEDFLATVEGFNTKQIAVSGQIYNNDQSLEFNGLNLHVGQSEFLLNGNIKGINLYAENIIEQFKKAVYNIKMGADRLVLSEFAQVITKIPDVKEPLEFTLNIDGSLNDLKLQTFKFGIDESYFSIQGDIHDLINQSEVSYNFQIDTLEVYQDDIDKLFEQTKIPLAEVFKNLNLSGYVEGSADTLSLNISAESPLGRFSFMGQTQLIKPFGFIGRLSVRSADISPFLASGVDTTFINFDAGIKGKNVALTDGKLYFKGDIYNSLFAYIPIDSLQLMATLNEGILNANYLYTHRQEIVEGQVKANFSEGKKTLQLKGDTEKLDLATLLRNAPVDSTSLNTSYFVDIKGFAANTISGRVRFQVEPSVVGGDSVAAHKIEIKLTPAAQDIRTFAVNSSLFDLKIKGDIAPVNIGHLYQYWSNYLNRHVAKEVLLDSIKVETSTPFTSLEPVQLKGKIDFKNLDIVKNYFPAFPAITTDGTLQFKTTTSASKFQFAVGVHSDTLIVNEINFKDANVQFSGRFRHDKQLKQYSNVELTANAKRLETTFFDMDSVRTHFRFHRDSLSLVQHVKQFSDTSRYHLALHGTLTDSTVTTVIDDFFLGNYRYAWQENKLPTVTYTRDGKIKFNSFRFKNKSGYLAFSGVLSPSSKDSVQVDIRDIDLSRISTLLREDMNFNGTLDGTFKVFTLSKQPAVQGRVDIQQLEVKNNFIGSVIFKSNYNKLKDWFDISLSVDKDSSAYKKSLTSRAGKKNIYIEGYYNPDAVKTASDSLFKFKANFNALDTWFLPLILEDIFEEVEGIATGSGYITSDGKNLDYQADMQLQNVFVKPTFVETNWHLTGNVRINDRKGVVIDHVNIRDENNGSGVLYGKVDLTTNREEYLDLKLQLNKLKFIKNNYEVGIPFYGGASATGKIRLVGYTKDLRLSSEEDIIVSPKSKLGIPLVTSTQVAEADEFIEFVDSFKNIQSASKSDSSNKSVGTGLLEEEEENITFTDRVDVDLQFRAEQPINVTLLFDPSTGERLNAEGTGNLRLIMEGGDVQLFGRFNVTGGVYHFVSGQIFQRELEIRSGGTIVWTGDPEEATLNVEAVYHARPEVASLTSLSQEGFSRSIPVNLVIEITGTINDIQQNYYFELPSFVSATPTLQYRINRINSNEERKLLQSASILLSGEFISSGSGAKQFGEQLTQGRTFINPIISNQIVSPLLSDQINALLNSEVAEVDIDFKLNAYNEIDLGVALRLYNDRLILQRQGRITGPGEQNIIGNVSVAYRITPNLSIRAFHRQIPTLGVTSEIQTTDYQPSVNGVGLKAQFRFNTWLRLWRNVQGFFGVTKTKDDQTKQPTKNNTEKKINKENLNNP